MQDHFLQSLSPDLRDWLQGAPADAAIGPELATALQFAMEQPDLSRALDLARYAVVSKEMRILGWAAVLSACFDHPKAHSLLDRLLRHSDPRVRRVALEASQIVESPLGLRRAIASAADPEPAVSETAVRLLREAGDTRLQPLIEGLLDKNDTSSISEAAAALIALADEKLLELMSRCYGQADLALRKRLAEAMAGLGSEAVAEELQLLAQQDPELSGVLRAARSEVVERLRKGGASEEPAAAPPPPLATKSPPPTPEASLFLPKPSVPPARGATVRVDRPAPIAEGHEPTAPPAASRDRPPTEDAALFLPEAESAIPAPRPDTASASIFSDEPAGAPRPAPGLRTADSPADSEASAAPAAEPHVRPHALAVPAKAADADGKEARRRFEGLLRKLVSFGGSDLHLKAGMTPYIRHDGRLMPMKDSALGRDELVACMRSVTRPAQMEDFLREGDLDLSLGLPGVARFRLNFMVASGQPAIVARIIPTEVPSIEKLNLPEAVRELALSTKGLLLVTGPTGSGKSTTLASMIDLINSVRRGHIITIEDPVEFIHRDKLCSVTQREVGTDVQTFADGVRFALRQDPDVILVGELRDLDTVRAALQAAGAGRLVLATLHTNSASKTVERILNMFGSDDQAQARVSLSLTLTGVISQSLVGRIGGGRIAAHEILVATGALRKAIREKQSQAIYGLIESGAAVGMITLEQALSRLASQNLIPRDEALAFANEPSLMGLL